VGVATSAGSQDGQEKTKKHRREGGVWRRRNSRGKERKFFEKEKAGGEKSNTVPISRGKGDKRTIQRRGKEARST